MKKLLLFILFMFISTVSYSAVYKLYPADTLLDQANATTNYNTATTAVLTSSSNDKLLLTFDLSGIESSTITASEFRINEYLRGGSQTLTVSRVLPTAVATEATYNIYSTGNNWDSVGASTDGTDYSSTNEDTQDNKNGGADPWVVFDVTELVKDMIDNSDTSIVLRNNGAADDYFRTNEEAESGDLRPYLYISTGTPGVPTNYYVRVDGGTCGLGEECTGKADVDYDGSGTDEECACESLYWAAQVASGEDIIYIDGGDYEVTQSTAPTSGTANAHTQIIGDPNDIPVFYGAITGGVVKIGSYTTLSNLIIRDRNGCIIAIASEGKIDDEATQDYISCSDGSTGSSNIGIAFSTGATGATINNVKIYGMSNKGVQGYGLSDISFIDSEIWGSGFVGWDGDYPGTGTSEQENYSGDFIFDNSKIMYSGCGWRYKATPAGADVDTPHNCWSQDQGGYGDGFGMNGSSGSWTVTDSEVSFNASDGLDFLYGDDNVIKVFRSKFEGSAGASVKSGNNELYIDNSILLGNCAHWSESEWVYASINAPGRAGSNCNTDGACDANENWTNCADCAGFNVCRPASQVTVSAHAAPGAIQSINNSILSGNSDILFYIGCSSCDGTEIVKAYNNILIGGTEYNGGQSDTVDWYYAYGTGTLPSVVEDYNIFAGTKTWDSDCTGEHSQCFASVDSLNLTGPIDNTTPDYFDYNSTASYFPSFYLTASSTVAIDGADETITCESDCSRDVNNFPRGDSWDIGALEYGSVPTEDSTGITFSNVTLSNVTIE